MTHTLHELFGQLRSHLHEPAHVLTHRAQEIVQIITLATELDPERVAHEWHAYLAHAPRLPALTATSTRELHALGIALPDHRVAFDLSASCDDPLTPLMLEQLCTHRAMTRVDALIVDGCPVTTQGVRAITSSAHLNNLRSLSMSGASLDTGAVEVLCAAPHLRALERLNLSHNDFNSEALEHLAMTRALPSLTHLDISHKRRIDAESSHVILTTHIAAQLVELGINRCGLRALTNELTHHTSLQALDISSNYMNDIDLSQFIAHPNSHQLRRLDLSNNSIGDQGMLMVLNACARMHTLHMAKTRLTELAADHLVQSAHTDVLESLDLSRTRQYNSGAMRLADGRFSALRSLYMDECKLDFSGIMVLLASEAFPKLRRCSLAQHGVSSRASVASTLGLIDDRASRSVLWHERERAQRDAAHEPALLNLRSNNLRAVQFMELVDALDAYRFTHLDVSDNPIGERGFSHLMESKPGARLTHLTAADVELEALTALTCEGAFPALRYLILGGNGRLGDEAARRLCTWSGLGQLRGLDLRACGLSASGVRAVFEAGQLDATCVDVRCAHNAMTTAEKQQIQQIAHERGITHDLGEPGSL